MSMLERPRGENYGIDPAIATLLRNSLGDLRKRTDLIRQEPLIISEVEGNVREFGDVKRLQLVGHLLRGIMHERNAGICKAAVTLVTRAVPLDEFTPKELQSEYRDAMVLLKDEQNAENAPFLLEVGVAMAPYFSSDAKAKKELFAEWMQFAKGREDWKTIALGILAMSQAIPHAGRRTDDPEGASYRRAIIEVYEPGQTTRDIRRLLEEKGIVLNIFVLNAHLKAIETVGIPLETVRLT